MYIISPVLVTAELLFISFLFNTLKIMYMRIDKLCVEILNIFYFFLFFLFMWGQFWHTVQVCGDGFLAFQYNGDRMSHVPSFDVLW